MFLLNYKYQEVKKISRLKISKILKSSSASASAGRKNNNKSHRKNELIKILRTAKKKQALAQSQSQVQAQAKCDNNERLECLNQLEQSVEIFDTICEKKSEAAVVDNSAMNMNVDNADNEEKKDNNSNDDIKKDNASTGGSSKTYQVNVLQAHRLEIWFANLGFNQGKYNETGVRPVLILSNDIANTVSPIVTVAPMTSRLHKLYLPTHVLIYPWEVSDVNAANNVEQHSTKGHYHKRHYHRHSYKRNQEYQRRQSRQSRQLYSRLGCVLLEQITLLDKRQLRNCIGKVTSPERIKILNDAIKDFLVLV